MYALASAGFQPVEPAWKHWRKFDSLQLPPATRCWLLDEGSLTARLQAACGNAVRVRVLRQAWQRPRASERRALGLGIHELALVREVLLECAGEPWVFARSIMPAATLHGRLRHLRRFGERSLGALLGPALFAGGLLGGGMLPNALAAAGIDLLALIILLAFVRE